jgi:hypothetical protein
MSRLRSMSFRVGWRALALACMALGIALQILALLVAES